MSQAWVLNTGSGPTPPAVETLTGDTGGPISPQSNNINIIGGDNVTVDGDNGTATLTINVSGSFSWTEIATTSASMAINHGYIANNAGLVTLTLPSTAPLGSVIKVAGKGAGGWSIAQNTGQIIWWNSGLPTTTGVTGSISSLDRYDTIELVCITTNTTWIVNNAKGNMDVV